MLKLLIRRILHDRQLLWRQIRRRTKLPRRRLQRHRSRNPIATSPSHRHG
jgi:hypothetical protein